LKIALSPYLSRKLYYFDQIWQIGANFHSEHGHLTKKNRIFQDGGRTPCWKSFLAISGRLIGGLTWNSEWRCRYRSRDQKWKFSQIQDGGRPPFSKVFGVYVIPIMN